MNKYKKITPLFTAFVLLVSPILTVIGQNNAVPKMTKEEMFSTIFKAENLQQNYDYYKAMDLAQDAKVVAMYYDNSKALTKIYKIIGQSYEVNGELNKSFENYNKAIMHAKLNRNDSLVTLLYYNLARLTNLQKRPIEETMFFYERIIDNAQISQDELELIRAKNKISQLLLMDNKTAQALPFLESASFFAKKYKNTNEYIRLNYLYAYYHMQLQETSIADEYLFKTYRKGESSIPEGYEDLYQISSLIYSERGDFDNAYRDLLTYNEIENAKLTKEKLKEVTIANAKFEVENYKNNLEQIKGDIKEKESQITQWKTTIALACLVLLISLAFLITTSRNSVIRKKLNNDLQEKNHELFEAKEAAEQVSQLKSQFVSTVSHELRTPLYGVIGLTELLRENPDSDNRNEYLESLKFSGNYLLALINDVLQLSKIETNEITVENAPFNLKILVNSIVKSLHNKRHKNNNNLHIEIAPEIDEIIDGDSVRLSQILINLVGNALKFTKEGNVWLKVLIESETEKEYQLKFVIKDDGVGIPKDKQDTIFDNFSQVKNNTSEYQGTGLGLSIVKKLIDLYGSEIILVSDQDKGAEFSFILPIKRTEQKSVTESENDKYSDIGTTTKLNILIVDDNKINQIVTKNILEKKGYTTTIAGNGLEAIQSCKENSYDLVLMDVNMPEMGGLEATENIRLFDKNTPIIALTAMEDKEMILEAKASGMNDLIVKPYDTHIFYQTIIKNINQNKTAKTAS